jgi:hypothetical protein
MVDRADGRLVLFSCRACCTRVLALALANYTLSIFAFLKMIIKILILIGYQQIAIF